MFCKTCNQNKPIEDFYAKCYQCKECKKKSALANHHKRKDNCTGCGVVLPQEYRYKGNNRCPECLSKPRSRNRHKERKINKELHPLFYNQIFGRYVGNEVLK